LTDDSEVCDEVGERLELLCKVDGLVALLVLERETGRFESGNVEVRCKEKSKAGGR
jgi:hypothetical protein